MGPFLRFISLIFLSLYLTACNATTVRHTNDYQSAVEHNRQVVLLAPDSEVYSVELSGKKSRLYDYEYNMEGIISEELENAFRAKGFNVRSLTRRDAHAHKIEEDIAMFKTRYLNVQNSLYKQLEWDPKKAYAIEENIGDVGSKIASKSNSRFIVVTNYYRDIATTGSRAARLISAAILGVGASSPADLATLTIGIIDSETGRVLWTNKGGAGRMEFSSSSNKEKEKAELKDLLNRTLKPFLRKKTQEN